MSIMRPDSVFKYTTIGYFDNIETEGLSGSSIGPVKKITPELPKKESIEKTIHAYFSASDVKNHFYRQCKHFCDMSRSKRDSKEQFEKVIELYFLSLKKQYPNDKEAEQLDKIHKTIESTIKLLDNFTKDGKMENDYFSVALAALLVTLL